MVADWPFSQALQFPAPLSILLLGALATPFIGLLGERLGVRRLREIWVALVSSSALLGVYLLFEQLRARPDGILLITLWGQPPPSGGCLEVDALSLFMVWSVAFLGLLVAIYSFSYMERRGRLNEYYTLLLFMMAGMIGVAMAGDFFTLFVFWEMMCLSSYVLVAFMKERWAPLEAAFKYLLMSATAGAFLLLSMSFIYGMTGTLNFAQLSAGLRGAPPTPWLMILFSCLIVGFGVKSAIVPLHTWLPDAHPEAPSPISAMLSGIVIETGLYGLTRVLYLIFTPDFFHIPLSALAVLTMTMANIWALLQGDIKRLLAYSSIAQMGYMLIGVASGTSYGLMGTFLHVFNHSLMKGLAFLASGSIVHEAETRDIERLRGVGRMMPISTLTLFISLLGLGGIPSTNGFVSKFILFNSAILVGAPWLAVAGVLNSAFSMAYYMRVMKALISKPETGLKVREAPTLMVSVTTVMAGFILLLGVWPEPALKYASEAARALVEGFQNYIRAVVF